jgi:hypothetical protein
MDVMERNELENWQCFSLSIVCSFSALSRSFWRSIGDCVVPESINTFIEEHALSNTDKIDRIYLGVSGRVSTGDLDAVRKSCVCP